ncbi:MAG: alpha/beta hydrolase [Rhodoferax sp.]|nr:alpha/beta hydrolase [Rhodoferax sp.]
MTTPPFAPYPMPTDPEVLAYIARTNNFYPADAYTFSADENRAWYNRYAAEMRGPMSAEVSATDFSITAQGPPRAIPARLYRHAQQAHAGTVFLYLHGGGFLLGGLESHADACSGWCAATGIDVLAIAYRLAPEHPHPAQLDDVQAAFVHLYAQGLRVIVGGDSAGGNLAAALCLRQRAQGGNMPVGQLLIYPGLGGDTSIGSYVSNANAPMLTTAESAMYFGLRTGGMDCDSASEPELMPLKAADFLGMPPAFVVTADIDPLRDDGRTYVERLQADGVAAQYRNEAELVHGYLRARHMSRRAAASFAAMGEALVQLASGGLQSEGFGV